ncbi:farnesoate epoxidase-like isoform X2 [Leptidea sinapis]|uniref:farnesoate epoxidase-like isoform X2 n=1 Tax=Leptidea sinapis TaxID=189913 RepID=UPI0021409A0E|nr:farnesoate epoxidase-like isoform X2 [Leptidea sinapis]
MMRSFGKKLGIVFSDGATWTKTRRAVIKALKNFSHGSSSMENNIGEEVIALIEVIKENVGKPIIVNDMFDVAIVNIVWKLVAGKRYDLKDGKLRRLCDLITRSFKVVNMSGGLLTFMPFLRHVIPNLIGYNELRAIHNGIYKFISETIDYHKATLDTKNPRDVIDKLLIDTLEKQSETFTDEELQVTCRDLLEAGVETVSNTIVFMLLYLVRAPEVRTRLQDEIDRVVGTTRLPSLSDRSRMVYTEAVILETLRISSVAAVGIPHMALQDATLGEYVIPKGTFVLLAIHDLHNGCHWNNPHEFRPERFLTKEGNLIQSDWLMPFGYGKRRCIGEGLARSELFLFTTYLLQRFHLKIPEEDPLPSTEPHDGVTLSARKFRVIFQRRHSCM